MDVVYNLDDAVGSEQGWVYCLDIIDTDLCKIGKTGRKDLLIRIEEHNRCGRGREFNFAWAYPEKHYERAIHRELKKIGLLPPMSEMGSYEVFRITPENALTVAKGVISRRTPHLPTDAVKYLNDDLLERKVIEFLHLILENQERGRRSENQLILDMAHNLARSAL